MALHYKTGQKQDLKNARFRIPSWMDEKITEVQRQYHMVTRTEAARLIMVKGLEALGIDLNGFADEEEAGSK